MILVVCCCWVLLLYEGEERVCEVGVSKDVCVCVQRCSKVKGAVLGGLTRGMEVWREGWCRIGDNEKQ